MPANQLLAWIERAAKGLEAYPKERGYLVGVSCGVDSRVLLQILLDTGFINLVICHLDHRLRGSDSERENRLIRQLATRLKLPLVQEKVQGWPPKLSLETAARQARQQFFARTAKQFGASHVFLGHHADDQVETFLFNILRGAGSIGQAAMRTEARISIDETDLIVVRPLLHVWKQEIREYAKKRRLKFSEDVTNAENKFTRNRIRNLLVPEIERILGRPFKSNLLRLCGIAADEAELLRQLTPTWWELDELPVRDLRTLPVALQRRVIHEWLTRKGIDDVSFEDVEQIRSMLTNQKVAKVNLSADYSCRRRASKLFIAPQ
ncbi:MAG: tRNA lysidine(34) synthetase TilS [Verrucomicrobia bacterium]|nr:tRNA lysidine(34) synthetase TilS [Verrucomicrobiota bacterium]MBV8481367.1 tRNA lysidine(34) synthetase TilS [Verrucomicrobiota bacterium]